MNWCCLGPLAKAPIHIRARPADTTKATEAGLTSISFVLARHVWRLQHIIQWTTQYQTELSLIRKATYDTELILIRKAPTTRGGIRLEAPCSALSRRRLAVDTGVCRRLLPHMGHKKYPACHSKFSARRAGAQPTTDTYIICVNPSGNWMTPATFHRRHSLLG